MENNTNFTKKHLSSQSLAPILHEQFLLQLNRSNLLMKALQKMTMEDELPITSTRKEKSGVLMMETITENSIKWRDYYFVLFEGALFYYKDSKSTTPTGFMTLKFASISIDVNAMINNEFVFHVVTPLRTIACKTKHAVALTEWIAALENALLAHVKGGKAEKRERLGSFGGLERSISGNSNNNNNLNNVNNSNNTVINNNINASIGERERSASDNGFNNNNNNNQNSSLNDFRHRSSTDRSSAVSVMQQINKYIAEVQNLSALVNHAMGHERFRDWLTETRDLSAARPLDFYLLSNQYLTLYSQLNTIKETESSSSTTTTNQTTQPANNNNNNGQIKPEISSLNIQLRDQAELIFQRFLLPSSLEYLNLISHDSYKYIESNISLLPPPITLFDSIRRPVLSILTSNMREFKRSSAYLALSSELEQTGEGSDLLSINNNSTITNREIIPFDPASIQIFTLRVKGTKRSREIKFLKKDNLWTIGRDKSNKLVIEDSRVSRSHARVEYSDTQCEYIDLGSSCGSKLNGKPVLRAKLKSGDVLELGQSTIIFQVKQKKKSTFGIGNFFSSNNSA